MLNNMHRLNKLIADSLKYEYQDNGEFLHQLLILAQAQLHMILLEKEHKGDSYKYLREIVLLNRGIKALENELSNYIAVEVVNEINNAR